MGAKPQRGGLEKKFIIHISDFIILLGFPQITQIGAEQKIAPQKL